MTEKLYYIDDEGTEWDVGRLLELGERINFLLEENQHLQHGLEEKDKLIEELRQELKRVGQMSEDELRQELKRAEHRIDTLCTTISDRHKRIRELEKEIRRLHGIPSR